MFKKTTKAILKSAVKKIRTQIEWWDLEDAARKMPNFDQERTVYPWLNYLLVNIVREKGRAFRPHFIWGVLHAAHLAKVLGVKHISVIEFGVAGGNGLVSLENIAQEVEEVIGVVIDVYGFDTGIGLPKPEDSRDLPNLFNETDYCMDEKKLRKRLKKAQLLIGHVEKTIIDFIASTPAPVAFISFDLDYYSSTVHAFKLLEASTELLLPRIHCYFDDITGFTYSERTGERLAINEFNNTHRSRTISPIYGLRHYLPMPYANEYWVECMYLAHIFEHPLYGHNDGLSRVPGRQWDLTESNTVR